MHVWLCDVFDHNRDVEIPGSYCLVIRGRDKPSVFVYKRDSIHWSQMLVILLRDFSRVHVVLTESISGAQGTYKFST